MNGFLYLWLFWAVYCLGLSLTYLFSNAQEDSGYLKRWFVCAAVGGFCVGQVLNILKLFGVF